MTTETEQRILQAIEAVQLDVNVLKEDVNVLKGDVNTLKGDVNTLKGDVNALKGDVNVLKGDVNTLKGEMGLRQAEDHKRDDRLENLERLVDKINRDGERFNDRFLNYQSSIDRLINLSSSLIASATIAIIAGVILFLIKN